MKNLLIYLNPSHSFGENAEKLIKVQIENILTLGWKTEDVILITNFPYEFMGVRATEIGDDYFFADDPASTKIYTIAKIFENNLIFNDTDLYWMHDLDHFQMLPFSEEEIVKEMGDSDFALCNYGRRIKYNCGSIFFRKSAGDIFIKIKDIMLDCRRWTKLCEEERALMIMMTNNRNWAWRSSVGAENSFAPFTLEDMTYLSERVHQMPITYNFADYNAGSTYRMCGGEPKTAHFNPFQELKSPSNPTGCKLPFFLGDNRFQIVFLCDRLNNLFNKYGIIRPD